MSSTKKIIIGVGIAGLALWLLTGDRRKKTIEFVSKGAQDLKKAMGKMRRSTVEPESHYN